MHPTSSQISTKSHFKKLDEDIPLEIRSQVEKPISNNEPNHMALLKTLYGSCINIDERRRVGMELLKDKIGYLGGWPIVIGQTWNSQKFDLTEILIKLMTSGFGTDNLVNIRVMPDMSDTTKNKLWVISPSAFFSDVDTSRISTMTKEEYILLMRNTVLNFGADNSEALNNEIKDMMKFEEEIYKHSTTAASGRDITLEKLSMDFKIINWSVYLHSITGFEVKEDEKLVVYAHYLSKLVDLKSNFSNRTIANYMIWRTVFMALHKIATEKPGQATFHEDRKQTIWAECLDVLSKSMGVAYSSFYIRHYPLDKDSKKQVDDIFSSIRSQWEYDLVNNSWMALKTKKKALRKSRASKHYTGYPLEILDAAVVDDYYKDLTFNAEKFLDNIFKLKLWSVKLEFKRLRIANTMANTWQFHAENAATVTVYHMLRWNTIDIQAAILKRPFFVKDLPKYINYGAIGHIIGHEIIHGYDYIGREYDEFGNFKNWWKAKDRDQFLEKAECLSKKYDEIIFTLHVKENGVLKVSNRSVNGKRTLKENVADNAAANLVYRTYLDLIEQNGEDFLLPGVKYTQKQLFWISLTYNYCTAITDEALQNEIEKSNRSPAKARVFGILSNNEYFAADFNCKRGTKMNPEEKCIIF